MPKGKLTVISGCMFSGKTARLIECLTAARRAGQRTLACKHRLDKRYDASALITHDGRRFPARAVETAEEILRLAADCQLIGIDEGQFFGRALLPACDMLLGRSTDVIVAGIDHDAWGQPFPPLPELCLRADAVERLSAPCTVCGRPAAFSQRMVPVVNGQMVGGPDEYQPRCREHFRPLPPPAPNY